MASFKTKVMVCDNPTCNKTQAEDVEGIAYGIRIDRATYDDLYGGSAFAKVYACSWECLGEAAKHVYEESLNEGPRKRW